MIDGVGYALVTNCVALSGGKLPDFGEPVGAAHWKHQISVNVPLYVALAEEALTQAGARIHYHAAPTKVALPQPVVNLTMYSSQNFAILEDSSLWSWGNNGYGQLGQGLRGVVGGLPGQCVEKDVILVQTGSMFALCVLRDGTMLCAGFNNHAELGDGTTFHKNVMAPNGMDLILN